MKRSRILAAVTAAVALGASSDALAYCRTAGCEQGVGAQCEPAQASDCGVVLSWPASCLSYSLQADGTRLTSFDTVQTLMRTAFDAWQQSDCSGSTPGFQILETDTVACSKRDFDQNGGSNANLIVFRDDDWPYDARGVLALTTVTYGLETGTIRDADMEINSQEVAFTFGDENVEYDFLSVVTHEAGHFLGLAHSPNKEATMRLDYERKSVELRSLSADDVAGICAVFPPVEMAECAVPTPEGGLRGSCGDEGEGGGDDGAGGETDESCAVSRAVGSPAEGALPALGLALAGSIVAARRRARRRAPIG